MLLVAVAVVVVVAVVGVVVVVVAVGVVGVVGVVVVVTVTVTVVVVVAVVVGVEQGYLGCIPTSRSVTWVKLIIFSQTFTCMKATKGLWALHGPGMCG